MWGRCQPGRDPLLGKTRSQEQAASLLSAVTAGRTRDEEVSEDLLRLVPPLGHRARALRDQRSSGAVKWGWWLTSCPLSMAVRILAAPSGSVAWTGTSWATQNWWPCPFGHSWRPWGSQRGDPASFVLCLFGDKLKVK